MNEVELRIMELREIWKTHPEKRPEIEAMIKDYRCCYHKHDGTGCKNYVRSFSSVVCEQHVDPGMKPTTRKKRTLQEAIEEARRRGRHE